MEVVKTVKTGPKYDTFDRPDCMSMLCLGLGFWVFSVQNRSSIKTGKDAEINIYENLSVKNYWFKLFPLFYIVVQKSQFTF